MWKVTIKPFVWVKNDYERANVIFECSTLQEAVNLIETIMKYSDINQFELCEQK